MKLRVTYAVLLPYSAATLSAPAAKYQRPKDLPPTYELDIEVEAKRTEQFELDGHDVERQLSVIDSRVLVAEHTYTLPVQLGAEAIKLKNELNLKLRERFLKSVSYQGDMVEEYVTLMITTPDKPDAIVAKYQYTLAKFLRFIDAQITREEAKEILSSQIRHGQDYLAVIDWEGAILISNDTDFESDQDLLIMGNYQLLRYRMLDAKIDLRLQQAKQTINSNRKSWFTSNSSVQDLINTQLNLLLDYDKIDESILLIGDWYSGKLYRIISQEFYIQDWRDNVKNKLETLSQAEEIIREKYTISWDRLLDFIQIAGWLLLLAGYFVLYYLEFPR